jgi:hypothetical protein
METFASEAFIRKRATLKQNKAVVDEASITEEEHDKTEVDESTITGKEGDNKEPKEDNVDDGGNSEKGLTRDKVAEAIGIRSGKTFDRMRAVIDKADTLKGEGNNQDSKLFISILNRSPSAAHDLLSVDLNSLSDEDREKLMTGKVAPRAFKPKDNDEVELPKTSSKGSTTYKKVKSGIEAVNQEIKGLTKIAPKIKKDDERSELFDFLNNTIAACNELLETIQPSSEEEPE